MKIYDIAILGAGPAGIMAAITAVKNKKSAVLIDRNPTIGRKILVTGNGRCNLTNRNANSGRYHGAPAEFVDQVLQSFDQFETIKYFESLGIILKEEDNGRIFPRSNQASTIVDALEHELKNDYIELKLNSLVRSVTKKDHWGIILENGDIIKSQKLILATGGKSAHHLGSSGDGYYWAEKLGHKIIPTYPALVPLETVETWPKELSGLKIEGMVSTYIDNKLVRQKEGDILFTHFGLSGPAAMAQAGAISPKISGAKIEIKIDLFPDKTQKEIDSQLTKIFNINGPKIFKNTLSGIIPLRLGEIILFNLAIDQDKKTAEISKKDRQLISFTLKNLTFNIKNVLPFKDSQVTAGGISTNEINPQTLESKIIGDLYFAGEVMNVDGDSGGFNLQWAWSSGHLAGVNAG